MTVAAATPRIGLPGMYKSNSAVAGSIVASALPVGDLGVRMGNDGHEPDGAEKQRPARIPVDPEHRGYSHPPCQERARADLGCLSGRQRRRFFHPLCSQRESDH